MTQPTPVELLDRALAQPPGIGEPVECRNREERERLVFRLYAAMSADARRSARLDELCEPGWSQHRWGAVRIKRIGETTLWIGRAHEFKVGEPGPLPTTEESG